MFEFKQDTAVLQGAFLSAQRQIQLVVEAQSTDLCGLPKDQLRTVTKLVTNAVALNKRGSYALDWDSNDALAADIRAHATVFYTVLRSAGVRCNAADNYYSSLSDIFPVMDWSVYVALLKSCKWCKFFVECIKSIPREAASHILKNILAEIKDEKEDYYILSSVLEAILLKLLNVQSSSVLKGGHQKVHPKFSFPFFFTPSEKLIGLKTKTVLENATDNQVFDVETTDEELEPSFSDLLNAALEFKTKAVDGAEVLKIYYHGLLALIDASFKLLSMKNPKQNGVLVMPFIDDSLKCVQSEATVKLITQALSEFTAASIKKELVLDFASWDIDIAYLTFLVYSGCHDLSCRLKSCDEATQDSSISRIEEISRTLFNLLPLSKKGSAEEQQFMESLIFIAKNKLLGMNYALEIFVQNPHFLEQEQVIACLERSTPRPAEETFLYGLLTVIMEKSVSKVKQLIPIFFSAMKDISVTSQQQILQHFLSKYELNEAMKQQSFSKQMSSILNQTVNAEQAEKQIILFCLQSPKECVSRIIHQAINGNSGQIPVLVKMLKLTSSVCAYRKSEGPSLLVNELKPCFSSTTLIPQQLKNTKLMIQEMLQILGDADGLKPSEFLICCVLPYINLEYPTAQVSFALEILEIALSSSLSLKQTSWLSDVNITAFAICMGEVINFSLAELNGSLKEKTVLALNLMSELLYLEEKAQSSVTVRKVHDSAISLYLASVNPIVRFYIWKFLGKQASPAFVKAGSPNASLITLTWLHNCIYEEKLTSQDKEIIFKYYESSPCILVATTLAQVLPHLTVQEWVRSFVLVEEYLEYLSQNSQELLHHNLVDRNYRLCASVGIFVDALISLRSCSAISMDWSYILCNLTKTVSNQLNSQRDELQPNTFVKVFLEICRLASRLEEEHLQLITVLLLDIFKMLKEMLQDTDNVSYFFDYLFAAADTIPDCATRSNLLGSLKVY